MNQITKIIFLIAFLIALSSSCTKIKVDDEPITKYSICLGSFNTFEEADIFKSKIESKLQPFLKIKQLSKNRFILLYGEFDSSFDAGRKAFELFAHSSINYKIFRENDFTNDLFANILFVAKYAGRPSVFNFNLLTKRAEPLWSRWGRKVLAINHSKDRNNVFITTAFSYKKESAFPIIKGARLYKYSAEKKQVDEIAELGDALQIYTYWENEDTFKVNCTYPDSMKPEILIQQIYSFDKDGMAGSALRRTFDLVKDGFPKPPNLKPVMISPKGRFQMRNVKENGNGYIYLRDLTNNAEVLIASYNGDLKNSYWTDDEKFLLIIITLKMNDNSQSKNELLIVNTEEMRVKRNFYGPFYQNLLVHGNFLFFDEQNNDVPQIVVYDMYADSIYHKIYVNGGCGINYIWF